MPFFVSLRPLSTGFDINLPLLIPNINWSSHGSMTSIPCPEKDAIISSILISELQEACDLAGISLLTPCSKGGNTTKAVMDATSIHIPHAGAIYNKLKT